MENGTRATKDVLGFDVGICLAGGGGGGEQGYRSVLKLSKFNFNILFLLSTKMNNYICQTDHEALEEKFMKLIVQFLKN